ncbi:TATA element modulatory factor [Oopsacas minuta]|uniref:TATA element modulatory factor n=1 Tax=Oopsacas minuta TaxID=111878 RepID=A0AAV7JCX2_9METZ|nr:TATA element modulatory factor [Oopsacas minuta]
MSWKSIAWGAISQAQKSIDTVLSNANMPDEGGYNDLDAFSDISGYVGSTLYTSTPVPPKEPQIQEDSDPSPLPSDHSDTEICSLSNEDNISNDMNQELSDSNQMSQSTEFKQVDLFSVPSQEASLINTPEPLANHQLDDVDNSKELQDNPDPVEVENALDSDIPRITVDNQHSMLTTDNVLVQSNEAEEPSHSLTQLREMLKVREAKLFELHESYAQLHDKYELIKENARAEVDQLLAEKDEKIQLLFQEGEKLSKQEMQQNKHIRKQRNNIKDLEYKNKVSAGRLSDIEKVNATLKEDKTSLEISVKKEQEVNKKLETAFSQQEKELLVSKREQSNMLIKIEELSDLNSKSNSEISSLRHSTLTSEISTENAIKSAEDSFQQQMQQTLADQNTAFMLERRSLQEKLNDLEQTLVWKEQSASRQEDRFKEEIEELRAHVERGEQKIQQYSQSISSSTQPLLREIEHLRTSHNDQSQNWSSVESNLRSELTKSHQENARLKEDIHLVQDEKQMLEIRITSMDKKLMGHREEQQHNVQLLESLKAELAKSKLEGQDQESRFKLWKDSYQGSIEQLQEENRKLQADLLEREREVNLTTAYTKPFLSSLDIHVDQNNSIKSTEHEEITLDRANSTASLSDADQYSDTGVGSLWSSATQVDRLQQLLRQKEGQMSSYKQQTIRLEKTCTLLTDELAKLTATNQDLKNKLDEVPKLKKQLLQLNKRHETTLEMCGEKIEENEELKLDLKDIKEMYKSQTEELVTLLQKNTNS